MGVAGGCGCGVRGVSVLWLSDAMGLPCSDGDGRPDCILVTEPGLDSLCCELEGGGEVGETNRVPQTCLWRGPVSHAH